MVTYFLQWVRGYKRNQRPHVAMSLAHGSQVWPCFCQRPWFEQTTATLALLEAKERNNTGVKNNKDENNKGVVDHTGALPCTVYALANRPLP